MMEERRIHSELSLISQTEVTEADGNEASAPVLRLRLKKPKRDRKVEWTEGTVDNEDMGRKKSKCCCIYKKPVAFGESSSEEDEECEHCFGHPEKRKKNRKKTQDEGGEGSGEPIPPTDETPTDPNISLGETGQPPSIVSLEQ